MRPGFIQPLTPTTKQQISPTFNAPLSPTTTMETGGTSKVLFYPPKTNRFQFDSPKCALCRQNVYAAEEMSAAGKKYHKLCCKCTHCGKLLDSHNLTEHNELLYCKSCYSKSFGPKGYGHGVGAGISSMDGVKAHSITPPITPQSNSPSSSPLTTRYKDNDFRGTNSLDNIEPQSPRMNPHSLTSNGHRASTLQTQITNSFSSLHKRTVCRRCSKTVYLAEEVKAAGGVNCYQKHWGPRGVGFGIGAGVLSTNGV
ncbi:unnamed protein product [Didymodactylos carnosus]|uniref:LIM zinc-binding domain-containing protein n=1 Tax=Didymodactylos carnosus TaxID=1234261 RepID=A0A814PZD8_9BILA|nr:unnamed protein product [Didymodactylos carnosus]CAF1112373.1 unnamed protein product [Didymodactylos carnosus]CAF3865969.1 unnamed protein product [Didymodactylos carnosus]CAF3876607.1 unnamed protein product [Didymodactylos carnosus]